MKLIQCIIRPEKVTDVVEKLGTVATGLTILHAQGEGKNVRTAMYRGVKYRALSPKIVIEMLADDNRVDDLLKILLETARTGESGDGRIFVLPVEQVYHVRTGFMD